MKVGKVDCISLDVNFITFTEKVINFISHTKFSITKIANNLNNFKMNRQP